MSAATRAEVAIVGGGLAGLACARSLAEKSVPLRLLEAGNRVGGRVRTEREGGFLLDRGFQVLLTAYPEARRVLDFDALDLGEFLPGALVRVGGRFHKLADPWREPAAVLSSLAAPVGTLGDKLRIGRLRRRLRRTPVETLAENPETSTLEALRREGFSPQMIDRFFRPFLGGVFFERDLVTSSRKFEFVMKMFAEGGAALPAEGMGAIPAQLATALPPDSVRLGSPVRSLVDGRVTLESGETIAARAIVVAVDTDESRRLLGTTENRKSRATTCFQYAAEKAPIEEPILVLDGEGRGPVNHLAVPSLVAPSYAPSGAALVSASTVGRVANEGAVRDQLASWFGEGVRNWRLLRMDSIPRALPSELPLDRRRRSPRIRRGVFVCGDHSAEFASIEGALASGRRAGQAVWEELAGV